MKKLVSVYAQHSEIYDALNERAKAYAAEKGLEYCWCPQDTFTPEGVAAALKGADAGIIGSEPYGDSIFREIKDTCGILVRYGVGFDAVNLKEATENRISIAKTTAANAESVAEMAFSMIMAAARQHLRNRNTVLSGKWVLNVGAELQGKTLGILGFGAIGKKLAKLFSGFEGKLLVYDPFLTKEQVDPFGGKLVDVDTLFKESDAISLHMPYTPETRHLVNAERIAMMKKTAVLVCTSRGNIVDEDALYEALKEDRILGAGLDVYGTEPLPVTSPLLTLDNVVLTPHVASQTEGALWSMYEKAVDIAAAFLNGEEIAKADLVNPDFRKA